MSVSANDWAHETNSTAGKAADSFLTAEGPTPNLK